VRGRVPEARPSAESLRARPSVPLGSSGCAAVRASELTLHRQPGGERERVKIT
jgi:hypothetical protein